MDFEQTNSTIYRSTEPSAAETLKLLPQPLPSLSPLGRFTLRRSIQIKNILLRAPSRSLAAARLRASCNIFSGRCENPFLQ